MQGMSERQYAAHVGLSRGAIQKAKTAERLVLFADGSINAAASDLRRTETTDPSNRWRDRSHCPVRGGSFWWLRSELHCPSERTFALSAMLINEISA